MARVSAPQAYMTCMKDASLQTNQCRRVTQTRPLHTRLPDARCAECERFRVPDVTGFTIYWRREQAKAYLGCRMDKCASATVPATSKGGEGRGERGDSWGVRSTRDGRW